MKSVAHTKRIVLIGGGHAHCGVICMAGMRPFTDVELVCVSPSPFAPYSGMAPGVIAGLYESTEMLIDLARLCAAAGVRLITEPAVGVVVPERQVLFADRPPLEYDLLSFNVGSRTAAVDILPQDPRCVVAKPLDSFLPRLHAAVAAAKEGAKSPEKPLQCAIVGGGAAGVELAFALHARSQRKEAFPPLAVHIVDRSASLREHFSTWSARLVRDALEDRGIKLVHDFDVERCTAEESCSLAAVDRRTLPADLVVWVPGAAPQPLMGKVDLPRDERGFLRISDSLQSTGDANVFAVGDCATMQDDPTPKAGVYSVRQGPVLFENLRRKLAGKPLKTYKPQRGFLKLLGTGDGSAVLDYHGLAFHGRWCWRLKDAIDRRFMDKHRNLRPMPMTADRDENAQPRCLGCGGKIDARAIRKVLDRIAVEQPSVAGDLAGSWRDAAPLPTRLGGARILASVDSFAAPLSDPYSCGRIAAVHAASDLYAAGALPNAALVSVELPTGSTSGQERMLYEVLSGFCRELAVVRAPLIGGHTLEGPRLAVSATMFGPAEKPVNDAEQPQPGDLLLLTKPLGIGVILAANMQAAADGESVTAAVTCMLQSNAAAADKLLPFARCVTDVTGFGLAGHLRELLGGADVDAVLDLDALPLLPGAESLIAAGFESTLTPSNRAANAIEVLPERENDPRIKALFDPQTSGGLLASVPAEMLDEIQTPSEQQGWAFVGRIQTRTTGAPGPRIVINNGPIEAATMK